MLACVAENAVELPVLGVSWDGTGYGDDGTIWGGEFLVTTDSGFHRAVHLRTFRLPGGEQAVKEPRRSAIGLLYEIFGDEAFDRDEPALRAFSGKDRANLRLMLQNGLNAPATSSTGRLFDAVASMLDLCQITSFEGQGAASLEYVIDETCRERGYREG